MAFSPWMYSYNQKNDTEHHEFGAKERARIQTHIKIRAQEYWIPNLLRGKEFRFEGVTQRTNERK